MTRDEYVKSLEELLVVKLASPISFAKTATPKWQKAWDTLSKASKRRLKDAAGDLKPKDDLPAFREALFQPKYDKATLEHRNELDKRLYRNALKRRDVKLLDNDWWPYVEGKYIHLPPNPAKGGVTTAKSAPGIKGAEGVHNRAMLAHEQEELLAEKLTGTRTEFGRLLKKHKPIQESADVVHNNAHPLIAEINTSARHPKALQDTIEGWGETKAQGQMYKALKNVGWTPSRGIPVYGRQANAFQRKAEEAFAPEFAGYARKELRKIDRTYKDSPRKRRQELNEFKDYTSTIAGSDQVDWTPYETPSLQARLKKALAQKKPR